MLQQANLMTRRGHAVTVASPAPAPAWFPLAATYRQTRSLDPAELPAADVTVATFWTTIEPALALSHGEVVHYCQGLEGTYTHNQDQHAAIWSAYQHRIPAMAVAPHLARRLRTQFGRPARVVPQPLEPYWRPRWRLGPRRRRPRILVMSPFEIDWKGVPTALRAVRALRERGMACELMRLSQWPLGDDERALQEPDVYHEHLLPHQVPALMASCDLLFAPSWEQEGFGLPVLEAMACGLPVVASDVPCFADFAADAARLVPFDQPEAFAAAAEEVLGNPRLWHRMRRAGRRVARHYRASRAAAAAEEALQWVASGAWRSEL